MWTMAVARSSKASANRKRVTGQFIWTIFSAGLFTEMKILLNKNKIIFMNMFVPQIILNFLYFRGAFVSCKVQVSPTLREKLCVQGSIRWCVFLIVREKNSAVVWPRKWDFGNWFKLLIIILALLIIILAVGNMTCIR